MEEEPDCTTAESARGQGRLFLNRGRPVGVCEPRKMDAAKRGPREEKAQKPIVGTVTQPCEYITTIKLKWVGCVECEFYLIKLLKKNMSGETH